MMHLNKNLRTRHIQLDTKICRACWKCIDNCSKKVISKIDFFFHKHARLVNPGNCTGCLKCVNVCEYGAIKKLTGVN